MASPSRPEAQRVSEGLNRAVYANHIASVLEQAGINCVLDVGAHVGQYGRLLRGVGYQGLIVSFEPIQSSFAELEQAMSEQPPWTGHRVALGSTAGEAEMAVFDDSSFSSLPEPTEWARRTFAGLGSERREAVRMRPLDDVFDEVISEVSDPRVMLKIDAQGSEWEVLAGASESLPRVLAVQVEAAVKPVYEGVRAYTEVVDHLGTAGFELTGLFPVSRDPQLRIVELDCVLIRPEATR